MRDSELNREWLRQALDNPTWQEVVARVDRDLYSDWVDSNDAMERDSIFHTHRALELLVAKMRNMAHDPTSL